ncbi:sugar ABC transporter ATPase [Trinickia fusca]|uniref:Sugar ABC transporter ATPase n=1 Tax=Trinickia fusca TaxID=2419777 RepID=A0A494XVF5_9BURK|nr:sugar ABC transporter ATPase [Trinickia fusca]RKP52074.1 sugar ABC transporter ATPase [Trinickia fusca]
MTRRLPALALIAAATTALLSACGSDPIASAPQSAATANGAAPTISFKSMRSTSSIASCLSSRVGGVRQSTGGGRTQLAVGRGAGSYAWLITLTPSGTGTVVQAQKAHDADSSVDEPELRFHLARCSV